MSSLPLLPDPSRFPHPDWDAVHASVRPDQSDESLNAFWTEQGGEWVHLIKRSLGEGYQGYESANFWLVSREPTDTCRRLISWAEITARKVTDMLKLDHSGKLFGKTPIVVVHDVDTYYEYYASYLPDGDYAGSGGVYINRGYGHFVFCYLDMRNAERVMAHELTHAYVTHLPIPAWLNEGIAQLCEINITRQDTTRYEEIRDSIEDQWNQETIQEFWSGASFSKNDITQMHSYHLAKVLTARLARDTSRFHDFLHEAHYKDAGEAALLKQWGITLADLVADYLGEGDWASRPPPQ